MVKETRLYDLLQVSPDASSSDLKKAFRSAALKSHPDKVRSSGTATPADAERATKIFQEITTAYEVLSNESKRALYDTYGEAGLSGNVSVATQQAASASAPTRTSASAYQGSSAFAQAESLFDQFFGMSSAPSPEFGFMFEDSMDPRQNSRRGRKGRDIFHTSYCTLSDFYTGKTLKLSLTKKVRCSECDAQGGSQIYTCAACQGQGNIVSETRSGVLFQRLQSTCRQCRGTGRFIPEEFVCEVCYGHKLVDRKVILDIVVPRGAKPGYKVVLPQEADEGLNLIPGDVVITLQEDKRRKNPTFKRKGDDLFTVASLPLSKALCGGLLKLKHLSGETLKIYINRGDLANPNSLKVAKGYGMPVYREDISPGGHSSPNHNNSTSEVAYGDLVIKFVIEFPKMDELSEKQYTMLSKALDPHFKTAATKKNVSSSSSSSEDVSMDGFSPLMSAARSGTNSSTNTSATGSLRSSVRPAETGTTSSGLQSAAMAKTDTEAVGTDSSENDSDVVYLTDFSGSEESNEDVGEDDMDERVSSQDTKRFKTR